MPGGPSLSVWPLPPRWRSAESFDLPGAAGRITADARILIPMDELIDREKELARLEKEKAACQKDIDFLSGKLSNAGFVAKAPEKVIAMEREKLAKAEEKLARIEESIRNLEADPDPIQLQFTRHSRFPMRLCRVFCGNGEGKVTLYKTGAPV